jgi:hypothetical protein
MSNLPLTVPAAVREFPVVSRPPAETVAVVSRLGLSIFGAAAVSAGALTTAVASGGGTPSVPSARAFLARRKAINRIPTTAVVLIEPVAFYLISSVVV